MAAVDDPIVYHFDVADEGRTELIANNYDYEYDKVATFSVRFKFKEGILNNRASVGWAIARNAFGESNRFDVEVPVLLDTQTDLKASDRLNERFSDESFRVLSDFSPDSSAIGEYLDLTPWDSSKSLTDYDGGRGLMVVPGQGLSYPYGNWEGFLPAGSPDYSKASFLSNEKYFARVFTGDQRLKFGGVFVFEGLTTSQFLGGQLSVIISCSRGARWFNLRQIRNMGSIVMRDDGTAMDATGVMTGVREEGGKLYVAWSYPTGVASNQPLYFRLGMQPTANFTIKSISLLNADEEEDW